MLKLRLIGTGAAVLTLVGACGSDAKPCRNDYAASPRPKGTFSCTLHAEVTLRVRGAEKIDDTGRRALRIFEFYKGVLPKETWYASVRSEIPVDFRKNQKYGVGFDIAPGTYRGPGRYTLSEERPDLRGLQSPVTSAAFVEITSLVPSRVGLFKYGEFVKPCTVEVQSRMRGGRLRCPALADDAGREVSLDMTWSSG